MSDVLVVSSYLPGGTPYRSERFRVRRVVCDDVYDYSRGVAAVWGRGETLVVVEHDMECSDDLIAELVDCPEPLCSHAYELFWPSTHKPVPHYAHRTGPQPPAGGEWVSEGDEWADFTGIGFCKIAPEARVRPLVESSWQHVDMAVNKAVEGRFHLHWPPITHDHF